VRLHAPFSPPPETPPDGEAGFSLIETLVAFIVLATSLTAFFQAWSLATSGLSRVDRQQRAVVLAASVLERVGAEAPVRPGGFAGEDPTGLQWSVQITPLETAENRRGPAAPLRIDVTITDTSGLELATLATLRFGIRAP